MSTLFMQISNISHNSPEFPDSLRELAVPPKSINILGTLPKDSHLAVAGARRLTAHGELSAAQFASLISLMEITGKVRNLGAGNWVIR